MAQQLFKARGGLNDSGRYLISGAGVPGTAQTTIDAPVGSMYGDLSTGEQYVKMTAGAGVPNWDKVTRAADIVNMVSGQSWREPAIMSDATTTSSVAAVTALNTNTFDGQTVASGQRILFTAFTTLPNVYIVSGTVGNWTLTEDTNAATSGDTVRILFGANAGQLWMSDGTAWNWVDALTNTEEQFIRSYIGKTAPGAETPLYTSNNVISNGDSLVVATGKLDADSAIQSTRMGVIENINTVQQTELDTIETATGLSAAGAYVVPTGTTYLGASSSLANADTLLDAQIAANATSVANEVTRATNAESLLQTELNTTQTGTGLNADGTYTAPTGTTYLGATTSVSNATITLDTQLNTTATSLTTETTNRVTAVAALQLELDNTQTGSGLNVDGTYTAPTGTTYLGTSTSISNATTLLDAQVSTNTSAIATLNTGLAANTSNLQAELDLTQAGAGLNANGTFSTPTGTTYLGAATSLANSDFLLDSQIAVNTAAIANLNATTVTGQVNVQTEVDAIETGTGLNVDGTFTAPTGTNYLGTATSVVNLAVLLDTQLNTTSAALTSEVANRTNAVTAVQAEIDTIETGAGLNIDGTYAAPTGTTYLGAATSLANADVLLDAQLGTNTIAIANEVTSRTTADGNLQTQIGTTTSYSSTTVVTNGDALSVAIGKLDSQITGNIHRTTALNTTAAVVDSVLVDSVNVSKWVVFINDTTTPTNSRTVEILASHDGTAISDATLVDWNEFGELQMGTELPITVSVGLNGATGAAQAMELNIAATSAVDIKVARMTV